VVGDESPSNFGFRDTRRIGVDDRYDSSALIQNYAELSEEWQAVRGGARRGGGFLISRPQGLAPDADPANLGAATLDILSCQAP
jgi:hypothetical protein